MVGQSLWKNLKNLVLIDKELEIIRQNLRKSLNIIEKDQKLIPSHQALLLNLKEKLNNAEKNLKLLELQAITLKEQEDHKKEIMQNVKNNNELLAIEKELKTILYKKNSLENDLINSWHNIENLKKILEQQTKEKEIIIKQLQEGIENQQAALNDIKKEETNLLEKRGHILKFIPQEWQEKYESMKHNVTDPVVPIIGSSCSVCYYSILRQDLMLLKKSSVLPCRNCYRLLYYDQEESQVEEKDKVNF